MLIRTQLTLSAKLQITVQTKPYFLIRSRKHWSGNSREMCVCWRWGEWRTYRYRNSGSTGANEEQCSPAGETEEKAKRKKDIYMYSMYRERERERCSDLWLCSGSVSPQLLHISMRHQQRCSAANPLINLTPDTHTHQPRESQLIHHTRCSIHNVHAHTFQIQVMLMVLHQTSDLTRLTSHYRKKSVYTHSYLNQTLKKS